MTIFRVAQRSLDTAGNMLG